MMGISDRYVSADFGGRLVMRKELQRLQGILDGFPTTAAQDAALQQCEHSTVPSSSLLTELQSTFC